MEVIVRKAAADDLEVLFQFEQGVIGAERPFDPTLKAGLVKYYDLEMMLSASHILLVVAQAGNEVIGSGYARLENAKPYLQHDRHAYLGFMYTMPAYRGKGVIQKILLALEQWAATQQVTELRLDVYHENDRAIKAYEKSGFNRHMIEMRKAVNAGADNKF